MVVRESVGGFPDSDFGGRPAGGPSRPSRQDGGGLLMFGRPAKGPPGGLLVLFNGV